MEFHQTLCSSGLAFVSKQQREIDQQRNDLLETKRKLVYNNYDSLIKFSEFSNNLNSDFQRIEESLNDLKSTVPVFNEKCETFASTAQDISSHWHEVSLMLSKYPQIIEFLEIPQLLNNCIRSLFYDDALRIYKFVSQLCQRNRSVSPIFDNILMEVKKIQELMVTQILREMTGNLQLPACMNLIEYLRQTDHFTEEQLRVRFLIARDQHFQASVDKILSSNVQSISSIMKITETFRINIFDIVTQFRALFPDIDFDSPMSVNDLTKESDIELSNSKIISSWLLLKIESYENVLRDCLESSLNNKMNLPVESIMDNCFYFGQSMSKIGVDIRPQMTTIFRKFILDRFRIRIELANERFDRSISKVFKMFRKNKTLTANHDTLYKDFLILQNYESDLLEIFTEIKNIVPVALFRQLKNILQKSIDSVVDSFDKYIREHEFSLKREEFQVFRSLCNAFQNGLLPKIHKNFVSLCPTSTISKKLSVTTAEFRQIMSSSATTMTSTAYELDTGLSNDKIRTLVQTISSKC